MSRVAESASEVEESSQRAANSSAWVCIQVLSWSWRWKCLIIWIIWIICTLETFYRYSLIFNSPALDHLISWNYDHSHRFMSPFLMEVATPLHQIRGWHFPHTLEGAGWSTRSGCLLLCDYGRRCTCLVGDRGFLWFFCWARFCYR